ncbi:23868_t:CDS:2 [Gigaspora margarita]|uniref:23868_t:CDS:1 n=1 Tax=Gigaspora margarita TaxID=4874 RepID=A0ABN7UM24_GIGMA|nr:23868_t:CDS:2 [Gigaspora margarita]
MALWGCSKDDLHGFIVYQLFCLYYSISLLSKPTDHIKTEPIKRLMNSND